MLDTLLFQNAVDQAIRHAFGSVRWGILTFRVSYVNEATGSGVLSVLKRCVPPLALPCSRSPVRSRRDLLFLLPPSPPPTPSSSLCDPRRSDAETVIAALAMHGPLEVWEPPPLDTVL